MLQPKEIKRYSRHLILPEIGVEGQERLKQAKVLMIGAGGLGCPVLQYLTAAGVGTIGIVDDDVVNESNLQRQILFGVQDIGKKKVVVAAEKLAAQNPFVNFKSYTERITAENAEQLISEFDLVIDGSDNFTTRYLVNDVCVSLDKPLVFGSIHKFEGQVSVFNYLGGPTYRCLYPEPSAPEDMPNCSETGVLGVLPGMIGLYMANEVIKAICKIGQVLSGKLLVLNALENTVDMFTVARTATATILPKFSAPVVSCVPTVQEISLKELERWMSVDKDVYLVDVREPYEYEINNVGGINLPLGVLQDHLTTFPEDKKIVFCCQTGKRSMFAANLLKSSAFNGVIFNLKDGIS